MPRPVTERSSRRLLRTEVRRSNYAILPAKRIGRRKRDWARTSPAGGPTWEVNLRRFYCGALSAVLMLGMMQSPAGAAEEKSPGAIQRISVASDGTEGNGYSEVPQMSADGRYVIFTSVASNLVADDTNGVMDLFVHDRATGETRRVSETSDGQQISSGAYSGSISGNGRYVVFSSSASNLVPGDTNGRSDVFRKDLVTGQIDLVSWGANGTPANGSSVIHDGSFAISYDGRHVVYPSTASNIVEGVTVPERANLIYLRDMVEGTNQHISQGTDGSHGNGTSQVASISADGSTVVFESRNEWDPRDTNGVMDVYAHHIEEGVTELISVGDRDEVANNSAWRPRPSYDGRYVVFDSNATNLVPRDQGGITPDVFLRDLHTDRTEKMSTNSTGAPANDVAYRGAISYDGRFVAYWSSAPNHWPGKQPNWVGDIFLKDRLLGTTTLVSEAYDGGFGSSTSQLAALSGDGRSLAFMSWATNLVKEEDTNGSNDVFARTLGAPVGFIGPIQVTQGSAAVNVSGWTRATGISLAQATDPVGDRLPALGEAIGDIIGASAAYRADTDRLAFELTLDELPTPQIYHEGTWVRPGWSVPAVAYGVSFEAGDTRYEIRMTTSEDVTWEVGRGPQFDLYACTPVCVPVLDSASGSYGTTGHAVTFVTSLESIGAAPGSEIGSIRAFAGAGVSQTGAPVEADEVELGDSLIPEPSSAIGIAPAGTARDSIDLTDVEAGRVLSGSIPIGDLPSGSYDVWARHCLGQVCGYSSAPVTIGAANEPTATAVSLVLTRDKGDVLAAATLVAENGAPIIGRAVGFTLNGVAVGSVTTDENGAATYRFHRNEIKKDDEVGVSFAGDERLAPSSTSVVMPTGNTG